MAECGADATGIVRGEMANLLADEPLLGAFFDFCAARRGADGLLARAAVDPVEIPSAILPNLVLLDVLDGGARFRWRLSGTGVTSRFGRDVTGRFDVEVLSGNYLAFVRAMMRHAHDARVPIYSVAIWRFRDERMLTTRRLYVPLAADAGDRRVTQIVAAHDFGPRQGLIVDPRTLLPDVREIDELVHQEMPFFEPS